MEPRRSKGKWDELENESDFGREDLLELCKNNKGVGFGH